MASINIRSQRAGRALQYANVRERAKAPYAKFLANLETVIGQRPDVASAIVIANEISQVEAQLLSQRRALETSLAQQVAQNAGFTSMKRAALGAAMAIRGDFTNAKKKAFDSESIDEAPQREPLRQIEKALSNLKQIKTALAHSQPISSDVCDKLRYALTANAPVKKNHGVSRLAQRIGKLLDSPEFYAMIGVGALTQGRASKLVLGSSAQTGVTSPPTFVWVLFQEVGCSPRPLVDRRRWPQRLTRLHFTRA